MEQIKNMNFEIRDDLATMISSLLMLAIILMIFCGDSIPRLFDKKPLSVVEAKTYISNHGCGYC